MVTKVTYVGEGFTRKPPKYERFIRPMVRVHPTKISTLTDRDIASNKSSCYLPLCWGKRGQSWFVSPLALQALRFKQAHVTHPEVGIDTKSQRGTAVYPCWIHYSFLSSQLKATFCLPLIGVKKNPQSPMYTQLGVITKGTIIEVSLPKCL